MQRPLTACALPRSYELANRVFLAFVGTDVLGYNLRFWREGVILGTSEFSQIKNASNEGNEDSMSSDSPLCEIWPSTTSMQHVAGRDSMGLTRVTVVRPCLPKRQRIIQARRTEYTPAFLFRHGLSVSSPAPANTWASSSEQR